MIWFAYRYVATLGVWLVWVSMVDIAFHWINLEDGTAYSTFSAIWMSSNLCAFRFSRRFSGSSSDCDGQSNDDSADIDVNVSFPAWIDNKLKRNDCDDEYRWY
jgi:hypothetical protein